MRGSHSISLQDRRRCVLPSSPSRSGLKARHSARLAAVGEAANTKLAVPKILPDSVAANPNYLKILQTLACTPGKQEPVPGAAPLVSLQPTRGILRAVQKGVKIAENKTGKTDLYTGKKAVLHGLSQGTFSNILKTMTALDLVQELAGRAITGRRILRHHLLRRPRCSAGSDQTAKTVSHLYIQ